MSEAASEDAANSEALADSAGKPVAEGSDADDESEILSDEEDPIAAQKHDDLMNANGSVNEDEDLTLIALEMRKK